MKNLLYKIFLPICFFAFSMVGCQDENDMGLLPESVPLTMTVNNKSFVMGESLVVNFTVDAKEGEELAANEDFDIYLRAKSGTTDQKELFKDFPEMVTFKKGEKSLQVTIPVSSNITSGAIVDFTAFARGYKVTGASQTITVSDYYRVAMSLKGNADKVVKEGESFNLVATVPVAVTEEVVVTIVPKEGEEKWYSALPTSITIPAGAKSAESAVGAMIVDGKYTGDVNLTLSFHTTSTLYPLMDESMELKMGDIDTPLGTSLLDERWVYDNPGIPFMSAANKTAIQNWYTKELKAMKEGDVHPNSQLAANNWKFYTAVEFHKIPVCAAENVANNTFTPQGFAAQNTAGTQGVAGVDVNKYATVTDDGVMKSWTMKIQTNASGGASGVRQYGNAAFYSCKGAFKPGYARILPGSRVETRARLRGRKKGFNMAIWLMGTANKSWPLVGEVDILENPAGTDTDHDAHQTLHMGSVDHNPTQMSMIPNMTDWNIYWFEWVDETTVKMGINGTTTLTVTQENSGLPASEWPFTKAMNPSGFYYILTQAPANSWALGSTIPENWDEGFASLNNYTADRDNDAIPRLEIDWIRFYINQPKASYLEGAGTLPNHTFY